MNNFDPLSKSQQILDVGISIKVKRIVSSTGTMVIYGTCIQPYDDVDKNVMAVAHLDEKGNYRIVKFEILES